MSVRQICRMVSSVFAVADANQVDATLVDANQRVTVRRTWADVSGLERDYNYKPGTPIDIGVEKFINWYKEYYQK